MNNEINNQNYNEVPINNEVNNQNYNEVPINNTMSSQNYNQIQSNNAMNNQGYNQMPTNNAMNSQGYNQMSTSNAMNSQGYNQMPTNNTMNSQGYNQMTTNNMMNNQIPQKDDKNKNTLFLIIGVAVLIVIAIVILIVVLNKNKSKGNTINDYENNVSTSNNNNNQEQVSNDNNQSSQGSISYKGFDIPKQPGYAYEIDSTTGLLIGNNTFAVSVLINHSSLDELEAEKDQIIAGYEKQGIKTSNAKVSNYNGKKVLTIEMDVDSSKKAIFYVMDASNGYCFFGVVANASYTIDYSDINKVVSLLSNAKYTGSYRANTDDINKFEIKNPFKK